MFGERTPKNHDNYVERILNSEDYRLKQSTYGQVVKDELDNELIRFLQFQRGKKI